MFVFSLSLCFLSQICFPSLPTWIQSLHWTTTIFHLDEHHLWLDQKNSSCHLNPLLTNHTALPAIQPFLMVLPCVFPHEFVCVFPPLPSFQTPPVSLLPGLWKANEESWAEGSFCVLVKKNNLCQRKVLQQLCCRTCSQKGWRDVLAGRKGSAGGTWGHRGHPSFSNPPPAHSFTVT